jgi:isopenicillin N synthase-like dioxygenase
MTTHPHSPIQHDGLDAIKRGEVPVIDLSALSSDDPEERAAMPPSPYVFRGYFPIQTSALAGSQDIETPPDLCAVFAVNRFDDQSTAVAAGLSEGREGFFAPIIWPDIEGFASVWTEYYGAMESLATALMQLMAISLDLDPDPDWFDDKISHHISNLVVNQLSAPGHRTG